MQIWRITRAARVYLRESEASEASRLFDNASFEYESIEYLLCSRSVLCFFDMVSSCCVPECNQKGNKTSTGEKVSFFEFPRSPLRKKQWIHAIRREEGKEFKIVDGTKVCSLHFRREDIRNH